MMQFRKCFLVGLFVVAVAALCAGPVFAGPCVTNDSWTGPDKVKHLGVGLAVGSGVTLATKDPKYGLMAGVAVGAAKEVWDRRQPNHTCSLQDFLVTSVGAAAGAYGTAWLILPQKQGFQVAFAKRF